MINPQLNPQLNHEPSKRCPPMTIDEALVFCRSKMTREEVARLDAETPPCMPETRPRYMTHRDHDMGPKRAEPKF
jgi:hypothetical protein